MPVPTLPEFEDTLHTHIDGSMEPAAFQELFALLRPAFEAVAAHHPLVIKPASAPWQAPALAFEATWPDTRVINVAIRQPPHQGTPAQVSLHQSGQLVLALSTDGAQLAATVERCLNR